MKFFLAQLNPIVGDLDGNAKKILYIADKAYSNCADLVLTQNYHYGVILPKIYFLKNI